MNDTYWGLAIGKKEICMPKLRQRLAPGGGFQPIGARGHRYPERNGDLRQLGRLIGYGRNRKRLRNVRGVARPRPSDLWRWSLVLGDCATSAADRKRHLADRKDIERGRTSLRHVDLV